MFFLFWAKNMFISFEKNNIFKISYNIVFFVK